MYFWKLANIKCALGRAWFFLVMRGPNLCARSSKPDRKHSGFTTGEIPDASEMNQITLPPRHRARYWSHVDLISQSRKAHHKRSTNIV